MKKEDLKAGMVVKVFQGGRESLAYVTESKFGACVSGELVWFPLNSLTDDLRSKVGSTKITEVYDLADGNRNAWKCETTGRKLLWKRETHKELTVKEIERLLGYPIKIVKES